MGNRRRTLACRSIRHPQGFQGRANVRVRGCDLEPRLVRSANHSLASVESSPKLANESADAFGAITSEHSANNGRAYDRTIGDL